VPAFTRHRNVLFALALSLMVSALAAISFERKVATFEPLGFDAVYAHGLWQVRSATPRASGLLAGDAIMQVAGEQPRTLARLRAALNEAERTELAILRHGAPMPLTYLRPKLEIDYAYLVLCLVGLGYLLVGLFTVLRHARSPAMLFFFWCLASATLYIVARPVVVRDVLDQASFWADQLASILLPALTLHLLVVFPAGLPTFESLRRLLPWVYLPAAVLLTYHADLVFNHGRWLAGPPTVTKLRALDKLDLVSLVTLSLLGAAVLAVRLARHRDWHARRQVQWVLTGLIAGYVPFLALYALPQLFDAARPAWLSVPAVLALGLVPLAFAYAILEYRLWDLGSMLRDAVANSLTVLLGVFGFVLINQLVSHSLGVDRALLRNLLTYAAGLGIAGVLVPARSAISGRLDRWRHGRRMAQRRALARLGAELMHERDLDRLCRHLVRHLRQGLGAERANILLSEPGGLVPVVPERGLPRVFGDGAFEASFWQRDVLRLAGAPMQDVPDCEQQLFLAGYRYAFPLALRSQAVGIAVLGNRAGDAPLGSEDVALVRSLCNQAALALENARLLDEVHRQLRAVTRLEASSKGILESSPAGIALIDPDGTVRVANHAFAAIVATARPDVLGRSLETLVPVAPLIEVDGGMHEIAWCEAGGHEHYLQVSLARHGVTGEPGAAQVVAVLQDISERRKMEASLEEKERLASLGLVAAGVAHEVNTPLTGIASYAQMLLADTPVDHPHRGLLEKMERQAFRVSQIVNNLLDFARRRGEPMRPVALEARIRECLDVLAAQIDEAGVELRCVTPSGARVEVMGHEGELTQVLTNLLVNALDAMACPNGPAPLLPGTPAAKTLEIRLSAEDAFAVLRVADSGPGIPAERLARVFEPFFSSKLHSGGTGLGLAICHNIIRRHGGEIRAENLPERGCVFTIRLPRHTAQEGDRATSGHLV